MNYQEYRQYDAVGLAQLIRQGEVSSDEVLQVALARLDEVNPKLNLLALDLREHCHSQPYPNNAPLAGVPFLLKDLLADWQGTPTASGSLLLKNHIAQQDSHLAAAYRTAGLRVFGKTTLPEWGLMPYTESQAYGITRNPWHTDHISGGSSGGSAAAVAAGVVPAAHGGDGGGSIRLPAHNCGLFGLKPTRGRSSSGPLLSESWQGLVCEHVLSRSVRDSAILLDIAAATQKHSLYQCPNPPQGGFFAPFASGSPSPDATPRRRIAYWLKPWLGGDIDPAVRASCEHSIKLLADAGHHLEAASPQFADPDTLGRAMFLILVAETAKLYHLAPQLIGRPLTWRDVEPATWAMIVQGRQSSGAEVAWARQIMLEQQRATAQFFSQYDCLLTPVTPQPTPKVSTLAPDTTQLKISNLIFGRLGLSWLMKNNPLIERESIKALQYVGFTAPINISGNPAMSVPLYQHNGLPIGTHIIAAHGREDLLLQLAAELEQRQPWAHLQPSL